MMYARYFGIAAANEAEAREQIAEETHFDENAPLVHTEPPCEEGECSVFVFAANGPDAYAEDGDMLWDRYNLPQLNNAPYEAINF